jgi:hypothetical protein
MIVQGLLEITVTPRRLTPNIYAEVSSLSALMTLNTA